LRGWPYPLVRLAFRVSWNWILSRITKGRNVPKWRSMSTVTKCRQVDCLNEGFATTWCRWTGAPAS
jgi:hypothetical protein